MSARFLSQRSQHVASKRVAAATVLGRSVRRLRPQLSQRYSEQTVRTFAKLSDPKFAKHFSLEAALEDFADIKL